MLSPSRVRRRANWQIQLFSLLLVLMTSGGLLTVLASGMPNRKTLAVMVGLLVVTPALIRWKFGWNALFLLVPWVAWFRRVQTELNPAVEVVAGFDITLVLPDLLTACALVGYVFTQRFRDTPRPVPGERPLLGLLTAFIALNFLQVFNPMMGSIAAGVNGLRVLTLYISLYWLTAHICQDESRVYAWLRTTLFMVALTGLYGIYQFVVGLPDYDMRWAIETKASTQMIGDKIRIFSTFSFTSTFSHFMVIGALVAWGVMSLKRISRLAVLLAPLVGGIALLALAFTFVRSAFVALLVAGVAGMLLSAGPRKRLGRLVMLFFVAGAALVLNPGSSGDVAQLERPAGPQAAAAQLVTERVMSIGEGVANRSVGYRLGLWQRQFEFITSKFPLGLGTGAGGGSRFGGNPWAEAMAYTESQYVTQLVELGWPGFLLFVGLTGYALLLAIRVHDALADPEHQTLVRIAFMVQLALLVTGITGGAVLSVQPGAIYYWTAMGVVTAIARVDRAKHPQPTA